MVVHKYEKNCAVAFTEHLKVQLPEPRCRHEVHHSHDGKAACSPDIGVLSKVEFKYLVDELAFENVQEAVQSTVDPRQDHQENARPPEDIEKPSKVSLHGTLKFITSE